MMKMIKKLWSKYKALKWWQKILLAIPFLIVILLSFVFMFKKDDDSDKFEEEVDRHRIYVDKQIKSNVEIDKVLAEKDKIIKEKQIKLKEEIKENEETAKDFIDRIDIATANHDDAELKRILSALNSSSRQRPVS